MLKHAAAQDARVVHNDERELLIAGPNWTVRVREDNGELNLSVLHNDSAGKPMAMVVPKPIQ
jgi:hypothetical protein